MTVKTTLSFTDRHHQFLTDKVGQGVFASQSAAVAAALEQARTYARERQQFGRPLTGFPLIQGKLAEMAARTFASESALYRTAGLLDEADEWLLVSPLGGDDEGWIAVSDLSCTGPVDNVGLTAPGEEGEPDPEGDQEDHEEAGVVRGRRRQVRELRAHPSPRSGREQAREDQAAEFVGIGH